MGKYKRRKRRKKHYLVKFLLLVAFCGGVYYFATSSFFDINIIEIKNNNYYTTEQVIDIAKAKSGGNIFVFPVESTKDRLLKDPYIKGAKISRRLPDIIIISIAEREEIAAVPYGDEFVIIDRDGMVLRKTDEEPALTLFTGMILTNIQAGTPLEVEENHMLSGALNLLYKMEEHDIFFKRIDFSDYLIRAYIYDHLICQGSPENILKSMDDLEDVLYDLYVQGIERGIIKVGGNGYYSFSADLE